MKKIISLHGFLGRPSDWSFLPKAQSPDLFADKPLSFDNWAEKFCAQVTGKPILVGYSMGGRLAMHALLQRPELFRAAVIISAHPGLPECERPARIKRDEQLASRFLTEPWELLMSSWNTQPVLQGCSLQRDECDYQRETLSEALNVWSLGRQEDLREQISEVDLPIHFVVGEKDETYVAATRDLKFKCCASRVHQVKGGSHRLPFEKQLELGKLLSQL